MDSSTPLLVTYKESTLRLSVSSVLPRIDDLRHALVRLFALPFSPSTSPSSSSPTFHLGYLDDESDFVRMTSDQELLHYLVECSQRLPPHLPHLTVVSAVSEAVDAASDDSDLSEGSDSFVRVEAADFQSDLSPTSPPHLEEAKQPTDTPPSPSPTEAPLNQPLPPVSPEATANPSPPPAAEAGIAAVPPPLMVETKDDAPEAPARSSPPPSARAPPVSPAPVLSPPAIARSAPVAAPVAGSGRGRLSFASVKGHPLYPLVVAAARGKWRRWSVRRVVRRTVKWIVMAFVLWAALHSFLAFRQAGEGAASLQRLQVEVAQLRRQQGSTQRRLETECAIGAKLREESHSPLQFQALQSEHSALEASFLRLQGMHLALEREVADKAGYFYTALDDQRLLVSELTERVEELEKDLSVLATDAREARKREQQLRESQWANFDFERSFDFPTPDDDHSNPAPFAHFAAPKPHSKPPPDRDTPSSPRAERAERREREKAHQQRREAEEAEAVPSTVFPFEDLTDAMEALYNSPLSLRNQENWPPSFAAPPVTSPPIPSVAARGGRRSDTEDDTSHPSKGGKGGKGGKWGKSPKADKGAPTPAAHDWEREVKQGIDAVRGHVEAEVKAHHKKAGKVAKGIGKAVQEVNAAAKRVWKVFNAHH